MMKNRTRRLVFVLLSLLLVASVSLAKDAEVKWEKEHGYWTATLTQTTDIGNGGRLEMKHIVGSVEVIGGAAKNAEITIELRLEDRVSKEEAEELFERFCPKIKVDRNSVQLNRSRKSHWRNQPDHSITITANLPKKFDVDGSSDGGSLKVESLEGTVDYSTGGGSIAVMEHKGMIDVSSGGGSMDMRKVDGEIHMTTGGGSLELEEVNGVIRGTTGGGSITLLDVHATRMSRLTTGGGGIELENTNGSFDLTTGGGALRAEDCAGDISITTGGGAIRMLNVAGNLTASTGGGNIQYRIDDAKMASDATVDLRTGHGDIDLYLPKNVKATVTAKVDDYRRVSDIRSDFPIETEEVFNDLVAVATLNGGGSDIRARTANSKISIHEH